MHFLCYNTIQQKANITMRVVKQTEQDRVKKKQLAASKQGSCVLSVI